MVTTATELNLAIVEFVRLLEKGLRIEAVVLFGSHARGTAHEDSDVDLAVISPDFEGMPLSLRQITIANLSVHRPPNLSPIGYPSSEFHNPDTYSFLGEILETGRVVYPLPEASER